MAANDYYVIVYRVLAYLYNQLKAGEEVGKNSVPNGLAFRSHIGAISWRHLVTKGWFVMPHLKRIWKDGISISPAGISFLHENSTISKVKNAFKGIIDIVGNIPGL